MFPNLQLQSAGKHIEIRYYWGSPHWKLCLEFLSSTHSLPMYFMGHILGCTKPQCDLLLNAYE